VNTQFPTANKYIHHNKICSDILLLLRVQNSHLIFSKCKRTLYIHFCLIQYRRVAFVRPIILTSNNIRFRRKALLLWSFGWRPLLLHEQILNNITNRSFLIRTFNSQVPNDKDCRDTFGYKWKFPYS
jgi:hypothetical protein